MANLTEFSSKPTIDGHTINHEEIEVIDGFEYKLFHNKYGPAFRVFDVTVRKVTGIQL